LNVERWTLNILFIELDLTQSAVSFQRILGAWYRKTGRDLPWRRTRDPYAILVSEFMLQQTQVATVRPYFEQWLVRFPDFVRLARASEADVLHAWQGLGYYARARNLHAAAKILVDRFSGRLPADVASIGSLPGVGRYTAGAIAAFAFDQPVPIVDANIARVLARLTNLQIPVDSSAGRERIWRQAANLVPARGARDFNSALIDLGALVCQPRQPRCGDCPVTGFCHAKNPAALPLKKRKPALVRLTEQHGFTLCRKRILLEQSGARWRGMWILPRLRHAPRVSPFLRLEFPFTHHRITLSVFPHPPLCPPNEHQQWFPIREVEMLPMPSPHRRALAELLRRQRRRRST
jgi:A/G-specific adenine glycosylase